MNDYSDSFIYLIPTAVSSPLHAQVQLVVRTGSDNDLRLCKSVLCYSGLKLSNK